jgi:hypothetical protein
MSGYRENLIDKIKELKDKIKRYDEGNYTYSEEEAYKELLDDCYPEYKPCGKKGPSFTYSDVLENCDPTMFRLGLEEYYDDEDRREELESELERLECDLKDYDYPGWDNEDEDEGEGEDEDEDNDNED